MTKKILEEEKETHNIFDGANEDDFTKKSHKAIRENLAYGFEDKEEELRKESEKVDNKKQESEDEEDELERS